MSLETIICPYCECKVKMNDVDDDGGICPECGAMITGSLLVKRNEDVEGLEDEEAEEGIHAPEVDEDLDDDDIDDRYEK